MMNSEAVFEATMMRVEHKFPMTKAQADEFMKRAMPHLKQDVYPEYDLHNIYYDTPDNALIIHCLSHPMYKEKLRLRTYGEPEENKPCFLEIKKKFRETGVKRRIAVSEREARAYMRYRKPLNSESQITSEIRYLTETRDLGEKMFIAYHRKAFSGIEEKDLRITFDTDICFRLNDLSLHKTGEETMITGDDEVLMEIKVSGRYPMWLTQILTEMKLYRQNFSKYGTIYSALLKQQTEKTNVKKEAAAVPSYRVTARKEKLKCLAQY